MRVLRCWLVLASLGLGLVDLRLSDAMARQAMSFSPGDHARSRGAHVSRHGHAGRSHGASRHGRGRPRAIAHAPARKGYAARGDDEGDAAKAVPGKGFTMENGILTYPAPARFQPRNLRPR